MARLGADGSYLERFSAVMSHIIPRAVVIFNEKFPLNEGAAWKSGGQEATPLRRRGLCMY
jgi:hypothetical protein